jgi:hypothetical protein
VSDTDIDGREPRTGPPRRRKSRVTVTRAPFVSRLNAGSSLCHDCPLTASENSGAKKYGSLKLRRTPRSSDE